ncbi:hypothetical protein F2P56_012346 [Juglans regia]|uniref:Uncharacterized protein LOC109019663 n=2 Tax=Juglans regia TaxID=51240 RepID=A0A2I4HN25_JUGRE|nr:uncharacterized protein LOC109019663 [Juglans regia]XP_035546729.1 uncharacterized protein LOC109019663 [Juglans regia]XP_035546730.1 uncharacterized protein LOC109019663 [Juglans regia]XP_035546731.1 uncharacterized protein LOC109019663 [Juglans regia]XP_035546732.1 uncharacterized protein LOC109019663 [Juglans regia]XP_035546733.1 uncharacterized protein LOC109019663 [Juglans regia]KAF5468170.1 hypothetical protein F2P56_012346 [Juglans regia]
MVELIPIRLQKTWEIWNVRGVILFSLSLQIVLFLGAPMRKRTGNKLSIMIIWGSYFLADWTASFTIGLITNSRNSSKIIERSDHLLAFWAPFLLLHLGGPDTITAFALEDNELWLRHFFTLIVQVVASFYVFLETLPSNKLWLPTSLIFLAGVIKYTERTRSLYRASWGTFRETMLTEPDPGPEYAKLMEAFSSKKVAGLPTTMSQTVDDDIKAWKSAFYSIQPSDQNKVLDEFEVVKYGYHFFKIFKGLVVDLISHKDRNESRVFFHERTPEDALEVLEVELNFIYEVLYTKFVVMHDLKGYLLRFLSLVSVLVSLGIFFFLDCKHGLDKFDIRVTYTLLLGALSLEAIALFKLMIFSDWTTAFLGKRNTNPTVRAIFKKYLKIRRPRWSPPKGKLSAGTESRITSVLLRRWSESVAGFNLITYCLKDLPKKSNECCLGISKTTTHLLHSIRRYCRKVVVDRLGAKDFLDELKYASKNSFTKELWKLIFRELLRKSKEADKPENIKMISSARGAYVLGELMDDPLMVTADYETVYETLKKDYIENVTYDESLLLWHIATELCYGREDSDPETVAQKVAKYRRLSKLLSDYMLYLLVMKSAMMSAVAGIGQIRYRDTCAEAKRFFRYKELEPNKVNDACENLLAVNTDVKPVHVKGDKSKSVLFDACMLAKELQKLEEKKWKVISKVWVEMLSYASNHCRPDAHVQQVSRGGQLINLVWLLMAHFGLIEQFVYTAGVGPAKLIVKK